MKPADLKLYFDLKTSAMFDIVMAATLKGGIGINNKLPWKIPSEMKYFALLTKGANVYLGRRTFYSINQKPLPGRINYVVSSKQEKDSDQVRWITPQKLQSTISNNTQKKNFLIGGRQLINLAMTLPNCRQFFLSRIGQNFESDSFLPDLKQSFETTFISQTQGTDPSPWDVCVLKHKNYKGSTQLPLNMKRHGEYQYLDLVKKVIETGDDRIDRTGVGTKSIFGCQMRFNLRHSFPLLTTKNVYWKGVVEELLWFMKGQTDSKSLSSKGVKIWDPNGSKEFLQQRGLGHRQEGDLGPVYGFQWRHFNAEYKDCHSDYTGQGTDQLFDLIQGLKNDPMSRRHILSAWNPSQSKLMALPPCHVLSQFYVNSKGELSCQLYQRSGDLGLGVPFNIASYSLLTYIIASIVGLKPGEFVHTIGDAHVYKNHIEALEKQLKREPLPFPRAEVNISSLEDLSAQRIVLKNYNHQGKLPMQMAV